MIAMEATIFTGWIGSPGSHAEQVKVAQPLMRGEAEVFPVCRQRRADCLNAKSLRSRRCYKKLNSAGNLIQRTTSESLQRRHMLHRTGRSQEDDQFLCEGCEWPSQSEGKVGSTRRELNCWMKTKRRLDGGDGGHHFQRLDL
jgi:hypothetical protein